MSDEIVTLISTLLAEHCIAADIAAAEARARYKAEPDCPVAVERCVEAILASNAALRAQNEFYALIGREVQHGNCH